MSGSEHGTYKHIPGMFLDTRWAQLFPAYFGPELLWGEWRYDRDADENRRIEITGPSS